MGSNVKLTGKVYRLVVNATTGTTQLVAAQTGKVIKVLQANFISAGTLTATFKTNTTAVTGDYSLVAQTPLVFNFSPIGHFETVAGDPLKITTNGTLNGILTYQIL